MNPSTSVVDTSTPSQQFWLKSQNVAMLAKYTPFIVCLASGKLDEDTFRVHIAQDVQFRREFERAFLKAERYADDDDTKDAISKVRRAVTRENHLHRFILNEVDIDPSKTAPSNPAIVKYTSFLTDTSNGIINGGKVSEKIVTPFEKTRIAAYTVGAMVPCMRLYAFLSRELYTVCLRLYERDHPFKIWMKNYSSSSFEKSAVLVEGLLDKLSVPMTGEELEVIQKLYLQAMKLEIKFLFMQPICKPVVVPLSRLHDSKNRLFIFSDFDLTCTVLDSSSILAEIAIEKAPKCVDFTEGDNLTNQMSASEIKNAWVAISTKKYEKCIESLLPSDEATTFDLEYLYKCLEPLSEFEKWANSKVIKSGMLRGLNRDDIKLAGEHLVLQDGCAGFFQKIVGQKEHLNAAFHIFSYCWCSDLVRAAFSSGCLDDLIIHGNEFEYQGSVTTGEIVRKMESPLDKVQAFSSILDQSSSDTEHFSVYIGDTVGDLLCLLEANVGIVIGSSEVLRKVGKRYGISFIPLYQGLVDKQRELELQGTSVWQKKSGVIYTVSCWSEIHAFILGLEPLLL